MKVIIIVSLDENFCIGNSDGLLWQIPEKTNFLLETTKNQPVIMGKNTFENVYNEKILPNRLNFVISENTALIKGVTWVDNLDQAIKLAKKMKKDKLFVIGGEQVFKKALEYADQMFVFMIHKTVKGNKFFPKISKKWKLKKESKTKSKINNLKYSLLEYEKE